MKQSESIKELAGALSKAQGQMTHAAKDATNPHYNKSYADLASVLDACRKPLSENGLSVSQLPTKEGDHWLLVTRLMHLSGEWIEGYTPILAGKQDAQGFGSGMTYARRYGLSAIVGIAQDDDDGNKAIEGAGKGNQNQNNNKNNQQNNNRQQQNQNNANNRETKSGPVKNEAPISAGDAKKLFELTAKKNISNDSLKEIMKGFYNIESTTALKMWQLQEITDMLNKFTLDQIATHMVEYQAEREFQKDKQ